MIRFLLKLLFWSLVLPVALVVTAYCGRNYLAHRVIARAAAKHWEFPLKIGAVEWSLRDGTLAVRDLQVFNPPEFQEKLLADVSLLKADYDTRSLFGDTPHLKELVLQAREIVIVKNERGESNGTRFQAVDSTGHASATAKTTYRVDTLTLFIGTVVTKDYSKGKPTERRLTLNQKIVFRNITESTSLTELLSRTLFGQVNTVVGDALKTADTTAKTATGTVEKTGTSLFERLKKTVTGQ